MPTCGDVLTNSNWCEDISAIIIASLYSSAYPGNTWLPIIINGTPWTLSPKKSAIVSINSALSWLYQVSNATRLKYLPSASVIPFKYSKKPWQ
mgnify:CR=1 FL=1